MNLDGVSFTDLAGDDDFLSRMLELFDADCAELMEHLQQSQWLKAQKKAHQIKGVLCWLEADELFSSMQLIEEQDIVTISTPEFRSQFQQQINGAGADIRAMLLSGESA